MLGKSIFLFGMALVSLGVGFESISTSFVVCAIGIFNMWVSIAIMINEKSEWIDEDLLK